MVGDREASICDKKAEGLEDDLAATNGARGGLKTRSHNSSKRTSTVAKDLRFYVERYADTNGDVFYIFPFKFENVDSETWSRLKNCASELGTRFSDTQLDKSTHDPDGNPLL